MTGVKRSIALHQGTHPAKKETMIMASLKITLPQGGTARGESLTGPSGSVSPTVSGGGKVCQDPVGSSRERTKKGGRGGKSPQGTRKERRVERGERRVERGKRRPERGDRSVETGKRRVKRKEGANEARSRQSSCHMSLASLSEAELSRKRLLTDVVTSSGSDREVEKRARAKLPTARRGKPLSSAVTTYSKAGEEHRRKQKEEWERLFQMDLERRAFRRPSSARKLEDEVEPKGAVCPAVNLQELGSQELMVTAEEKLNVILGIMGNSVKLKGRFIHKVEKSAACIREILDILTTRTEAEETHRLRANNNRLQREVALLRKEVRVYRRGYEQMKKRLVTESRVFPEDPSAGPINIKELEGAIARTVGNLVDGRLARLEERLLPPKDAQMPLAVRSGVGKIEVPDVRSQPPAARPTTERVEPAGKQRWKTTEPGLFGPSTSRAERRAGQSEDEAPPNASPGSPAAVRSAERSVNQKIAAEKLEGPDAEGVSIRNAWTSVVRKARNPKPTAPALPGAPAAPAAPEERAGKRKTRAPARLALPNSAAVIVTLLPEAEARGVTYGQAFLKAEMEINLVRLGITTPGFVIRMTATGSRLIEVPGGEQADLLAERLREVLRGIADISRPVKNAESGLTGLLPRKRGWPLH